MTQILPSGRIHVGRLARLSALIGSDRLGTRSRRRAGRLDRAGECLEIRHRGCRRKLRLVDRDLERLLERHHQFDPLERAQAKLVDGRLRRDRAPWREPFEDGRDGAAPLRRPDRRRGAR